MNLRFVAALALACLPACGCCRRHGLDVYMEAMNAERRALEDRLYDLEYDHEVKAEELAACRRDNEKLRKELGRPAAEGAKAEEGKEETAPGVDSLAPPVIEPGLPEPPSAEPSVSPKKAPASPPRIDSDPPPSPIKEDAKNRDTGPVMGDGRGSKPAGGGPAVSPSNQSSRRWTPRLAHGDAGAPQDGNRLPRQATASGEAPQGPKPVEAAAPKLDPGQPDAQAQRPRPAWRPYR
jgi:hypothetical protein